MCIRDRVQEGPRNWRPELSRGAFCANVRAEAASVDGVGRWVRRRRLPGGSVGAETPREDVW
eukprot:1275689-Alexandrium_andersonii.AAC.1